MPQVELQDPVLDATDPHTRLLLLSEHWKREAMLHKSRADTQREELLRAWFVLKEFGHHPGRTDDTLSECTRRAMTARRAQFFMERFKHEEKLLGPNEQAALDYVIAMLEPAAAAAAPTVQDGRTLVPGGYASWEHLARALQGEVDRLTACVNAAAAPTAQPLTDEQVWRNDEIMSLAAKVGLLMHALMHIVRAVERAHGIADTAAPKEQQ